MVSVTPDTALNSSGLPAPPKPVRADRSPAPDGFASLIGNSAADAASNDRTSTARDQSSPRRRAYDAGSESRPPRDSSPSRDPTQTRAADDNSIPLRCARGDASTDVADASKPARSDEAKSTGAPPDTKAKDTSDTDIATDTVSTTVDGATAAVTVAAVAVPVAFGSTAISAGPRPPIGEQAPLAIAAAALANSSAINRSQSASQSSANPTPDATTASSKLVIGADTAAGSTIDSKAGVADAGSATQPASGDGLATSEQQAAAAITTVAAKTGFNATVATRSGARLTGFPTRDDTDTSLPSTDKAATAPRWSTEGKSEATGAILAAKPESSSANAPIQFSGLSREHTASTTGSVQADLSASGIQLSSNLQQPQSNSPAANQLSVTIATSPAVPLNALALQIAATAQSGKSRFEIRLDPAELGRIDVRIDIDRQGQMTSHLTVEKPETLAMLRQDAPQLQRALDDAGFKSGNGGLQFSLRDQSSSGQNSGNETGRHGQRLIIGNEDSMPAATTGRTYGRMLASSGGVDIRV